MNTSCNSSNGAISDVFLYGFVPTFEILAAVLSVLTIIIMCKTTSLKGVAGAILINDQITCLSDQLIVGLFCTGLQKYLSQTVILFTVQIPVQALNNASITFMLLSNVNIYMALCKADIYNKVVTKPRAALAIAFVWISSSGVAMLTLLDDEYRRTNCDARNLFVVSPIGSLGLHLTEISLFLVFPLGFSCFFLKKVVQASSSLPSNETLRMSTSRLKMLRLVRLFLVFAIITTVMYVLLRGLRAATYFTEDIPVQQMAKVVGLLNRLIRGLRPVLLVLCYNPMRETVNSMLRRCKPTNRVGVLDRNNSHGQRLQAISEHVL